MNWNRLTDGPFCFDCLVELEESRSVEPLKSDFSHMAAPRRQSLDFYSPLDFQRAYFTE